MWFLIDNCMDKNLITVDKAAEWASEYLQKSVTNSNISYLIVYGKVTRYKIDDSILIDKNELKEYYDNTILKRKSEWTKQIGDNLNWELALSNIPERERTKHVHKLHPYKGKFIPQLVEYFLDSYL